MTHVCFIEDTHLHGGTQIWVTEAVRVFLAKGHEVTLLTPSGGFVARDGVTTDARVVTYGFDDVVSEDVAHQNLWIDALAAADVAVCTVHPPRDGFHCSRFAARCIEQAGLSINATVPKDAMDLLEAAAVLLFSVAQTLEGRAASSPAGAPSRPSEGRA